MKFEQIFDAEQGEFSPETAATEEKGLLARFKSGSAAKYAKLYMMLTETARGVRKP